MLGTFPKGGGLAMRLELSAGPGAAARTDLGIYRWENTFGKVPYNLHLKFNSLEKNCGRGIDKSELLEKHDPSAPTPSSVMIQLKQDIIQILLNQSWNQETSSQTLENLETCLKNRMDLTPVGILGLGSLRFVSLHTK